MFYPRTDVAPQQLHQQRSQWQIVDVREDDEWQAGRIEGARHIPMDQLPGRLDELDRSRPVVTVCRSGNRSGRMAVFLASHGFDVANLQGGMKAWAEQGLPFATPDGRRGKVA